MEYESVVEHIKGMDNVLELNLSRSFSDNNGVSMVENNLGLGSKENNIEISPKCSKIDASNFEDDIIPQQ
ncbi:hypothetical protein AYI70_g12263 [Smittium culicis]|uniref:Uncharacterized protein n=1 Tax=Smittium culicis TaxID=133412 RepID=A0A1R1WY61_9FUNG|nr:hypothetical protein AYI70_g12263 [Smittium culicis]